MDLVEKILLSIFNFGLFVVLSILFVPSFLIVTYLEKSWAESMKKALDL
jgi:hypothetical protein